MTKGLVSRRKDTRVRSVRRLTAGFLHHGAPFWSPDSRLLGFTLGRGADSHWLLTDRKGRAARVLEGPVVGRASVAADYRVAYGRQVGATAEIWLLAALGTEPQRLLGGDGRLYRDPAFSPDGRFLAYAADDGPESGDSPLRLWMVDLARLDHTPLCADPPAIEGATGPIRTGNPAWSADGAWVFFDVAQGEHSAVAIVEVESRRTHLLTGPGFGSPAPLASGVLCVERVEPDQPGEVCLLQYRMTAPPTETTLAEEPSRFKVRSTAIAGIPAGAREPAVVISKKGTVRLAWTAPGRVKGGEPQRYDVHAGQLARISHGRLLRPTAPADAEATTNTDTDASIVREQSAAAAAGLSAVAAAAAKPEPAAKDKPKDKAKRKHADKADRVLSKSSAARDKKAARSEPGDDRLNGDEAPADAERGV